MTLWDLIRDFFVQHVFGGTDSNEQFYYNVVGGTGQSDGLTAIPNDNLLFQIGVNSNLQPRYTTLSDWLSTTATAISITIIVVLCCLFVYKIIKLIGGLIR